MRQKLSTSHRSGCPISVALDAIGDSWTLLIVRDLMFMGRKTFNEFLVAGEGIATNILTDRLARLTRQGIVLKQRDPADARRFVYSLTEKGMDFAPVLVELILWSAKHEQTDAPADVVQEMRSNRQRFIAKVRAAWQRDRATRRAT